MRVEVKVEMGRMNFSKKANLNIVTRAYEISDFVLFTLCIMLVHFSKKNIYIFFVISFDETVQNIC